MKTADPFRAELAALYPGLRRFARSLCGSRSDADDLLQDSMVRALRYEDTFAPGSNMKNWACTIIRFQAIATFDRRLAGPELCCIDDPDIALPSVRPRGEDRAHLVGCIEKLPPVMRDVACHLARGSTIEEMAVAMGCETGTVKSRTSRTRAALMAVAA